MHKLFKPKTKKSNKHKCPVTMDSLFKASLIPTVKYHTAIKNDDGILYLLLQRNIHGTLGGESGIIK